MFVFIFITVSKLVLFNKISKEFDIYLKLFLCMAEALFLAIICELLVIYPPQIVIDSPLII